MGNQLSSSKSDVSFRVIAGWLTGLLSIALISTTLYVLHLIVSGYYYARLAEQVKAELISSPHIQEVVDSNAFKKLIENLNYVSKRLVDLIFTLEQGNVEHALEKLKSREFPRFSQRNEIITELEELKETSNTINNFAKSSERDTVDFEKNQRELFEKQKSQLLKKLREAFTDSISISASEQTKMVYGHFRRLASSEWTRSHLKQLNLDFPPLSIKTGENEQP